MEGLAFGETGVTHEDDGGDYQVLVFSRGCAEGLGILLLSVMYAGWGRVAGNPVELAPQMESAITCAPWKKR